MGTLQQTKERNDRRFNGMSPKRPHAGSLAGVSSWEGVASFTHPPCCSATTVRSHWVVCPS